MSKLLKQLLKNSVMPAALMMVSKLLGIYIAVKFFDMDISLGNDLDGLFSVQVYIQSTSDALLANSFSNGLMLASMLTGFLYLTIKYTLYAKSSHDPRTIVKLTKFNLVKWVSDKNTVFTKIFVWGIFLLAACAITVTSSLSGETYSALGLAAFIIAVGDIWSMVRTFEVETAKIYPRDNNNYN